MACDRGRQILGAAGFGVHPANIDWRLPCWWVELWHILGIDLVIRYKPATVHQVRTLKRPPRRIDPYRDPGVLHRVDKVRHVLPERAGSS